MCTQCRKSRLSLINHVCCLPAQCMVLFKSWSVVWYAIQHNFYKTCLWWHMHAHIKGFESLNPTLPDSHGSRTEYKRALKRRQQTHATRVYREHEYYHQRVFTHTHDNKNEGLNFMLNFTIFPNANFFPVHQFENGKALVKHRTSSNMVSISCGNGGKWFYK